jgi:hypothetical protein
MYIIYYAFTYYYCYCTTILCELSKSSLQFNSTWYRHYVCAHDGDLHSFVQFY